MKNDFNMFMFEPCNKELRVPIPSNNETICFGDNQPLEDPKYKIHLCAKKKNHKGYCKFYANGKIIYKNYKE